MADDMQRLVVSIEAKIDQFQKQLDKATGVADSRMARIQKRFNGGSDQITRGMARIGKTALVANDASARLIAGMSSVSAGMAKTADGAVEVSHAIGGMSTQGMAAFHALRGGSEMLAQGVSPMRVLAMEMNNLTYAASGTGGLKGAMMEAFGIFKGMLNPVVALTTGIVGAGLAVVGLGASWARSQSKIETALTGVGKASGMTVGQINQIGEAVSKSGDLSTSEASDIATAIASTGRASAESTQKATALAHAYSLVFNKDLNQSATDLANAIADPGHAIDALNQRLGAWSAKQVELVKNLAMSGDRQKAAKIIIDGMQKSIGDATAKTDFWTRSWNGLTNAISNAITASGKAIDEAAGIRTPESALAAAEARLKALQQGRTGTRGGTIFGSPQEIQRQLDLVTKLRAEFEATQKAKDDSRDATDISNLVKGIDPTIQKLNELQNTIDRIKKAPVLDDASEAVRDKVVASLQAQHDALANNLALSKEQIGVADAQYAADKRSSDLAISALNARTPIQKAQIEYQQRLNELQDQDPAVAKAEAQIAYNKSLASSLHDLSEAQRDRIFQAGQSVEQQQLENQTIGLGVEAATTLTQRFQLLAAAKAEAHKNGTVVSPEELAAMDEAARKLGQLAQATAALTAQNNAKFDISQLGRTQSEQNVFSTLQGAGLLDNGQIVSAQAKQTAEILRTKEALSQLADTEKTFAQSFLSDLIQGKSAAAALGDALTAVANKLLDSGIDALISGATSSGANKGILSFLGLADGGYVSGPGSSRSDSIPARLSNGEFVVNAGATKKNRALLEAINVGKVGKFADGGMVGRIPALPRISGPIATPGGPNITIQNQITLANGTPEGVRAAKTDLMPEFEKRMRSIVFETLNRSSAAKTAIRKA